MRRTRNEIHASYCNYMINKSNVSIISIKPTNRTVSGITYNNYSAYELIKALTR